MWRASAKRAITYKWNPIRCSRSKVTPNVKFVEGEQGLKLREVGKVDGCRVVRRRRGWGADPIDVPDVEENAVLDPVDEGQAAEQVHELVGGEELSHCGVQAGFRVWGLGLRVGLGFGL